jgi:hypothetical protein
LKLKATFESGSHHILVSSAETRRAFNMGFDTANLHCPTFCPFFFRFLFVCKRSVGGAERNRRESGGVASKAVAGGAVGKYSHRHKYAFSHLLPPSKKQQ